MKLNMPKLKSNHMTIFNKYNDIYVCNLGYRRSSRTKSYIRHSATLTHFIGETFRWKCKSTDSQKRGYHSAIVHSH